MKIKKNNLYLVTGGSGFLGYPLVQKIISKGGKVRVLARDEGKLVDLKEKFPSIEIFPGDIFDRFEVKQAMEGVNGVFHLAASKHVGLAEIYVRENVKSNTLGSLNILEESLNNPNCKYRIVRYGNVLYSTGSVLCKWKSLIEEGKEVIVTEPQATRFFWTVDQAIQLIMDCLIDSKDSKPYCPSMKSMSIDNLLKAMIEKYSNGKNIPVKVIGLQPGENLHEKVLEEGPYSNEADQFTIDEIIELI